MTSTTPKPGLILRCTAVLALTAASSAATAQNVVITGTDDPASVANSDDSTTALPAGGGGEDTVTLTGNYGSDTYEVQAFENVDVIDAVPNLDLTKVATISGTAVPAAGAALGDEIIYTYTVTNTGNVTMNTLALTDVHNNAATATNDLSDIECTTIAEGSAGNNPAGDTTLPATNDNSILTLGRGDTVTCTATYTVEQADIDTLQNP